MISNDVTRWCRKCSSRFEPSYRVGRRATRELLTYPFVPQHDYPPDLREGAILTARHANVHNTIQLPGTCCPGQLPRPRARTCSLDEQSKTGLGFRSASKYGPRASEGAVGQWSIANCFAGDPESDPTGAYSPDGSSTRAGHPPAPRRIAQSLTFAFRFVGGPQSALASATRRHPDPSSIATQRTIGFGRPSAGAGAACGDRVLSPRRASGNSATQRRAACPTSGDLRTGRTLIKKRPVFGRNGLCCPSGYHYWSLARNGHCLPSAERRSRSRCDADGQPSPRS